MPSTHEQVPTQYRHQYQYQHERKAYLANAFDLASDNYDEANGSFFNPIGERLVELADLRPGDRMLDLGCGRGAVLFAAVAQVGPDGYVAGLDLSPGMVHRTAAQAAKAGLRNVSVRVGDAEDPGFPDRSFEAVLSSLALFLTPDPAAALASAHRVLVPGGHFGFTAFGEDVVPGWNSAVNAVRPFLDPPPSPPGASELQGRPSRSGLLGGDPATVAAVLNAVGFTDVRTVEETATTEYADADAWWRSLWAGGYPAMLETIPEDRREEARKAAFAVVEPLADHNGGLVRRTAIRYTTARRAG
jgi:ubiquinone/menaquinone biosynthesis C-methylase UbiE